MCVHVHMYPYMGFSKHEFACIPIAAVHSNTGSVYEYKLP